MRYLKYLYIFTIFLLITQHVYAGDLPNTKNDGDVDSNVKENVCIIETSGSQVKNALILEPYYSVFSESLGKHGPSTAGDIAENYLTNIYEYNVDHYKDNDAIHYLTRGGYGVDGCKKLYEYDFIIIHTHMNEEGTRIYYLEDGNDQSISADKLRSMYSGAPPNGAIVMLLGCYSIGNASQRTSELAKVFLDNGAYFVCGYDDKVSASWQADSTRELFKYIHKGKSIVDARNIVCDVYMPMWPPDILERQLNEVFKSYDIFGDLCDLGVDEVCGTEKSDLKFRPKNRNLVLVLDSGFDIVFPTTSNPAIINNPCNHLCNLDTFKAIISTDFILSEEYGDNIFNIKIGDKIADVKIDFTNSNDEDGQYTLLITPPPLTRGIYNFEVRFCNDGINNKFVESNAVKYSGSNAICTIDDLQYLHSPTSKKALILAPFYSDDVTGYCDELEVKLKKVGFEVDYKKDNDVTVTNLDKWLNEDYGLIHICTHGIVDDCFISIEHFDDANVQRIRYNDLIEIYEGCGYSRSDARNMVFELSSICITPHFIKERCGCLNHTIIFMEGCYMGTSNYQNMKREFMDKGAGAYVGFDGLVIESGHDLAKFVWRDMRDGSEEFYTHLFNGETVKYAVENTHCVDSTYYNCNTYLTSQETGEYLTLLMPFDIKFRSDKSIYYPNDQVKMEIDITNNIDLNAETWLGVSFKDPLGEVEKYDSQIIVAPKSAQIEAGETKTFTAEWQVPDDVPQGQYEIAVNCWKDETFEEKYTDNIEWVSVFSITPSFEFVPMDLCMVLDKSGSMGGAMGYGTRLDCAKSAAKDLTNILLPQDRVSVVSFASTATIEIGFTSDLNSVKREIDGIYSEGGTSFGAGLGEALRAFDLGGDLDHVPVIVLLSDGEQYTSPPHDYYSSQCENRGIRIYTVGFASSESEVDVVNLRAMSRKTGGEYYFADNIFDLRFDFLKIHLNSSGWAPNATYSGRVTQNEYVTLPSVNIPEGTDVGRWIIVYPGSNLDMILVDPNGNEVPLDSPNVIYSGDTNPESIIIIDPIPGTWTVRVFGKEVDGFEEFRLIFSEYDPPEPPIPPFGQNITINENSGQDLGDYQVLIELNPSDFPNKAAKNGADVRFLDKDRKKLNYWIKEWNDASKTAKIWLNVPFIPANGETEIEMRYGNQNSESQSDGDGTFEMFDDFDDGSIDSKKWIVNSTSSEFVIETDGELQIRSNPLTKTDADLVSRSAYGPNVAMKFRANISDGHWLDHKGAGFLSANVGNDFNEVGDSVYLRGEESRLYTLNRYPSPTSETLCTGVKLIDQNYEAGYQTWEIKWLDSEIGYYINDVLRSAHSAEGSSVKITPRFSINTYTAEPVDPAEISVDWIFVRKCASSEPTVQIEAAESAGE